MSGCKHTSCGSAEKIWLPFCHRGLNRGLRAHRYCIHCGMIRNISSDKSRGIGFYMNVLAALGREHKITTVQLRLIYKDLEALGLEDGYGIDRIQQERLFIDAVRRFLVVPERTLQKFMN